MIIRVEGLREYVPRPRVREQEPSPRIAYSQIIADLERELEYIVTTRVILRLHLGGPEYHYGYRPDEWPPPFMTPHGPFVEVECECAFGTLRFDCEHYMHWYGNLHAIAHCLFSLRFSLVPEVTRGRQYMGFRVDDVPDAPAQPKPEPSAPHAGPNFNWGTSPFSDDFAERLRRAQQGDFGVNMPGSRPPNDWHTWRDPSTTASAQSNPFQDFTFEIPNFEDLLNHYCKRTGTQKPQESFYDYQRRRQREREQEREQERERERKAAAPPRSPNYTTEVRVAAQFFAGHCEITWESIAASASDFKKAWQKAAHKLHPDKPGGSHDAFISCKRHKDVLERHHQRKR